MLNGRLNRRNSTRLTPGNTTKPIIAGPSLEFRWSTAATTQVPKRINRPPTPLPSLTNARSTRQKSHITVRTPSDRNSNVSSSLSMHKLSRLSLYSSDKQQTSASKQLTSVSPTQTPVDRCPTPFRPLILTYSQLHQPEHQLLQRDKRRISQHRPSVEKLSSVSMVTTKISLSSHPSLTSRVPPTLIEELHVPVNHLVRLHTPQLRRLNISEKYINEAKELYFDPSSKVFLPRISAMNVS